MPVIQRVHLCVASREPRDELFILESLEREVVSLIDSLFVTFEIYYNARLKLHLYVVHKLGAEFFVIFVLEIESRLIRRRYDIAAQNERHKPYNGRRYKIWHHQASEAHPCRQYGYYLRVVCHLGGKKYYRYKGK